MQWSSVSVLHKFSIAISCFVISLQLTLDNCKKAVITEVLFKIQPQQNTEH